MRPVDAGSGIEILDRGECLRLLATEELGRLAFVSGGAADILPVNYALDGDAIVFATADGTKVWAAAVAPVAFEVDHADPATRSGWSVVVRGNTQEITEHDAPALLDHLHSLPLRTWVGGSRPILLRIVPVSITGRRLRTPAPALPGSSAGGSGEEG